MRLIDADAFHDFIHKYCDDPIEELWHELVRGQPTAYDVDKVVERLEQNSDYTIGEDGTVIDEHVRLKTAIEIIKSGFVR